ncbi:MAG: MMPL family transporter, partial [Mycobacterium sp.]
MDQPVLNRITALALTAPRRVLTVTALLMVLAGVFAVPVTKSLSAGGFQDPAAESTRATQLLTDKFGQPDTQMILMVSAPDGVQS